MPASRYWFQKKGRSRYSPINWKGWALFAFVIGMVVSMTHVSDNPLIVGIATAITAAIGYKLIALKLAPEGTTVEIGKGRKWPSILGGCVLGMAAAFAIFFGILNAELWYDHTYIGSVQHIAGTSWISYHSVKDNFDVQLPSYPQYQTQSIPNAQSTAASYESDGGNVGKFTIILLKNVTAATSTSVVLINMYQGFRNSLDAQAGATDNATSSLITFDSDPAILFSLEVTKTNYMTKGVYVLGNGKVYALVYGNDNDKFSDSDFQKFMNSFRFDQATSTYQ